MNIQELRRSKLREWTKSHSIPPKEKSYFSQLLGAHASFGERAAKRLETEYGILNLVNPEPEFTTTRLKPISYENIDELKISEFYMVPYYRDVKLSAGNGEECLEQTEKFDMPFQNYFFSSRRIKPENAVIVRVKGNSMEPKYEDGGVVLIDLADKEIIDGETYAIRHFDVLRIKKLSISMTDGSLIIESLNPKWEAVKVPSEQIENITIIGRVRWNANG